MSPNANENGDLEEVSGESRPLLFGGGSNSGSNSSQQNTQPQPQGSNYASLPTVMARRPSPPNSSSSQMQATPQRVFNNNKNNRKTKKIKVVGRAIAAAAANGNHHSGGGHYPSRYQSDYPTSLDHHSHHGDTMSVNTRSSRRTATSRRGGRSATSLRSGPSLLQPNKPRQNCCLWLFHLLNGLAVLACVAVILAQVFPLFAQWHQRQLEKQQDEDDDEETLQDFWIYQSSNWERLAPFLLRAYVVWFALILMWVETEWCTQCLPALSESPLLQSYWSRGFFYTFLGIVGTVQTLLTKANAMMDSVTMVGTTTTSSVVGNMTTLTNHTANANVTSLSDVWHTLQQGDATVKQLGHDLQDVYQNQVTQIQDLWDDEVTVEHWVEVFSLVAAAALCVIGLLYMLVGVCCLEKVRRRFKRHEQTSWRKYRRALSEWKQQRELYPHHQQHHHHHKRQPPAAGGSSDDEHEFYYHHQQDNELYPLQDHDEESLSSGEEEVYYVSN